MSSPRRYCISLEPTHWVPADERLSVRTFADDRKVAEWIYESYLNSLPPDGVTYELELSEWSYEEDVEITLKRVEAEGTK